MASDGTNSIVDRLLDAVLEVGDEARDATHTATAASSRMDAHEADDAVTHAALHGRVGDLRSDVDALKRTSEADRPVIVWTRNVRARWAGAVIAATFLLAALGGIAAAMGFFSDVDEAGGALAVDVDADALAMDGSADAGGDS